MSAKDDCYRLIQEVAIKQAGVCQRPGCREAAACGHHIFKRDRLATAFRPDCVIGLCVSDHNGWAHHKPKEFRAFVVGRIGEERYDELWRLSNTTVKYFDFVGTRECLKGLLR